MEILVNGVHPDGRKRAAGNHPQFGSPCVSYGAGTSESLQGPGHFVDGVVREDRMEAFRRELGMETTLLLYDMLWRTVGRIAVKAMRSRRPEEAMFWRGRMGDYAPAAVPAGKPRIWCHAASVGEVSGALPTLKGLERTWPRAVIVLTVGTWQGYRAARSRAPETVRVLPFPLDFRSTVQKAVRLIQPDLYIAFESEFWPNLAALLRENRVPSILLNGRLSRRSFERYRLARPLFRPIFSQFSRLAMLTEEDRRHALKLGAHPERTLVLGSSKYEGLIGRADPARAARWKEMLGLPGDGRVVVGGSLRRSECTVLLDVFQRLSSEEPRLIGLFVPRHLEQIPRMVRWLENRKVPFELLSRIEAEGRPRRQSVVLVDRIGILFDLYGLGDLIFCGGTLEPIGGHNILEPAAWNKPVFYGPHVEKVRHEHLTLQSFGGSFQVRDGEELRNLWSEWLKRPHRLKAQGERAGEALRSLGGVVERQMELVRSVLGESG